MINDSDQKRFSRQIMLDNIGLDGQEKISQGKVLVIGAGGLGSPVCHYLAAAGIKKLGIVDYDTVTLSNLHRQLLHHESDISCSKVTSFQDKLCKQFPSLTLTPYDQKFSHENGERIIEGYDFVIDATDNFSAKFLINDICVQNRLPFSHGGVLEYQGQTMTVLPGTSCCYRCVFKAEPEQGVAKERSVAGILGPVAGMLGTIQATEALKYLTGAGTLLTDSLLQFSAETMEFRKISLRRQQDCQACG